MKGRTILHCDCNCFYASVEMLHHPELRQVPMAVCGDPESRHGVILAKNEPAKRKGVKTAETIWQAKQKCPGLVLTPPRHREYAQWSERLNEIYCTITEQVEPYGLDESYLDVTGSLGLFGDGKAIGDMLREKIRRETGLTISVGVSYNKIFAKLGSDHKKPDATTVIFPENVEEIVFPKAVGELLYVGRACERQLNGLGIRTIGDLAHAVPEQLEAALGRRGRLIWEYANGLDDSPVARFGDREAAKSVGSGVTFRRNLCGEDEVRLALVSLADEVAPRLRKTGLLCRTVQLTIRDPSLKTITRQMRLEEPTELAQTLADAALQLWRANWKPDKPIRMLTVTAQNLEEPGAQAPEQLSLFDAPDAGRQEQTARRRRLEGALDSIRDKYGRGAILQAGLLHNDLGLTDEEKEAAEACRLDGD